MFVLLSYQPNLIAKLHVAERIYVVWRPCPSSRRWECKPYIACLVVLVGYGGIVGVLFHGGLSSFDGEVCRSQNTGRISFFGDRGACYIGLEKSSSIALLTYDLQVIHSHRLFGCLPANIVSSTASSPDCSYGRWYVVQSGTPESGALHCGPYGPLSLHSPHPV